MFMNGTQVSDPTPNYAYRAYLETLINTPVDDQKTWMRASGWYKDAAGMSTAKRNIEQNKFGTGSVAATDGFNLGALLRHKECIDPSPHEVVTWGKLHMDILNQPKYLIPNVEIRFLMTRQPDNFILMSGDTTPKGRIIITKVKLYCKFMTPSMTLMDSTEMNIRAQGCRYPISRIMVNSYFVPKEVLSTQVQNVAMGQMPRTLIVGLLDAKDYNGDIATTPYDFKKKKLVDIDLLQTNKRIPFHNYELVEDDISNNCRVYNDSLMAMQPTWNHILQISLSEWNDGYRLYGFDLTKTGHPSLTADTLQGGSLHLNLRFSGANTADTQVLIYAIYDNNIVITQARDISTDFEL